MTPEQYNKEIILRLMRIERLLSLIRQERLVDCIGKCESQINIPDLPDIITIDSDDGSCCTLNTGKSETSFEIALENMKIPRE